MKIDGMRVGKDKWIEALQVLTFAPQLWLTMPWAGAYASIIDASHGWF